jgi:hypothetical protein
MGSAPDEKRVPAHVFTQRHVSYKGNLKGVKWKCRIVSQPFTPGILGYNGWFGSSSGEAFMRS